jgi:hypothetical protein
MINTADSREGGAEPEQTYIVEQAGPRYRAQSKSVPGAATRPGPNLCPKGKLMEPIKDQPIELTVEELDMVAGGGGDQGSSCDRHSSCDPCGGGGLTVAVGIAIGVVVVL